PVNDPAGRVQAVQEARGPDRVEPAVHEGRRRPRAGAGHRFPETLTVLAGPQLFARLGVVADDRLRVAVLLLREQLSVDDDHARPRRAAPGPPHLARRILDPVGRDRHARDDTVAGRAAELRPVAGAQGQRAIRDELWPGLALRGALGQEDL